MRPRIQIYSLTCLCGVLSSSLTFGQQSFVPQSSFPPAASKQHVPQRDTYVQQQITPLAVNEPGALSSRVTVDARPMNAPARGASQPSPPLRQPPVDVRLVAHEESRPPGNTRSPLRLAPRSESSRQGVERAAAPTPGSALVTVGGGLSAVLGVFLVVVWCTRRFAPPGAGVLPQEAVELLGRAPLTARQQMQLIKVGNKLLLVALSPTGIEPLTEITDATEVEHLLGLCRRGKSNSSTVLFQQTLAQLAKEPAPRGFVGAPANGSRGGR